MADNREAERSINAEHYRLDPTAMSGTFDTTDTGAGHHTKVENLAPIFEVARAHDLAYARRALDPDDEEVSAEHVQVSQGVSMVQGDPDAERQRVLDRANKSRDKVKERHGYTVSANASDGDEDDGANRLDVFGRDQAQRDWENQVAQMRAAEEPVKADKPAKKERAKAEDAEPERKAAAEPEQKPAEPELGEPERPDTEPAPAAESGSEDPGMEEAKKKAAQDRMAAARAAKAKKAQQEKAASQDEKNEG